MVGMSNRCNVCRRVIENNWRTSQQCSCSSNLYCINHCSDRECRSRLNCDQHDSCWQAHSKNTAEDHTPVDPAVRLFIQNITVSTSNRTRQQELHRRDAGARWFNIDIIGTDGKPTLRIYDRLNQLCKEPLTTKSKKTTRFPFLVSFIGKSAVGKSSLIRALLHLHRVESASEGRLFTPPSELEELLENSDGPVSRSTQDDRVRGTTKGVHLYRVADRDEHNTDGMQKLMLLADCEGFAGGITATNSEVYGVSHRERSRVRSVSPAIIGKDNDDYSGSGSDDDPSGSSGLPTTLDNISVEPQDGSDSTKASVESFYARFLYTMSSAVVFVTDHDSHLGEDLRHLFEWASSAIFKSVNNPSRKTLIIVQHMPTHYHPEFYEADNLKREYLGKLPPLWIGSPKLQRFREVYNSQQAQPEDYIQRNSDLFDLFFDKTSCCYIPQSVHELPEELMKRYSELDRQIETAIQHAQNGTLNQWNNYDVSTFTHIVQRAFKHFSSSDRTFDFYAAARSESVRPTSLQEHIAKFLHQAFTNKHKDQTGQLNRLISKAVATALVVSESRSKPSGYSEEIYAISARPSCEKAFEKYVDKYQRCSYTLDDGARCEVRRAQDHSHHLFAKKKPLKGHFMLNPYENNGFLNLIREDFRTIYDYVNGRSDRLRTLTITEVDRFERLLAERKSLFSTYRDMFRAIKSNQTCLGCLQRVPDHVLECSHALCLHCVQEFGKPSAEFECDWTLSGCPLCGTDYESNAYTIRLRPRCSGVRVLSLDGGGIRGVLELAMLKSVVDFIGLGGNVPIRGFFDLIAGTSTGGIIALALATKTILPNDMIRLFKTLAGRAFKNKRVNFLGKAMVFADILDGLYPQAPLMDGLIELFGKDPNLFSHIQVAGLPYPARVFVTAARDGAANRCIIASYNRVNLDGSDFEREEHQSHELKIWEAGLATSAAPMYLPAFNNRKTGKEYVDGALFANCPASVAFEEKDRIWPGNAALDFLVSIGTGIQTRDESLGWIFRRRLGGLRSIVATFFRNLDTESLWEDFRRTYCGRRIERRLHRLNVRITADRVRLDEYRSMDALEDMARIQSSTEVLSPKIIAVARSMMASLFFFEPDEQRNKILGDQDLLQGPQGNDKARMTGSIRCRLRFNSEELRLLVDKVDGFEIAEIPDQDEIAEGQPEVPDHEWRVLPDFFESRQAVKTGRLGRFHLKFVLETWHPRGALLVLAARFVGTDGQICRVPISGFPASLAELKRRAHADI